ncbi:DUF397 domain-containing protein [Actinomadura craniellae]|uniref:DUF397 domain-containing protein n=2 Tax=Actinomadura craniellae TaxID=2231787 RepID=A0A365H7J1_9ACTN|nr:DUF397 domain-containing protein [Actinomadura craniellae]
MVVWRKARRSDDMGGNCIELAPMPDGVGIRDSKDPDGPRLIIGRSAFQAFTTALKRH